LGNLGQAYLNLGQYSKAIEFLQQSLMISQEIGDRKGEANSLVNLGNAYGNLMQDSKASEFYQQALIINKEIGDREGEGTTLSNIGILFFETDEFAKATEALLDSVEALESLRPGLADADKLELIETQSSNYQFLQLSLVVQNRIDEALVASERGRNRAFVEQIAQRLETQSAENVVLTRR
jgi:tetratricopeptide (TPR) repeat protein